MGGDLQPDYLADRLLTGLGLTNLQGWPEPYIYVYIHRIFGDFQAKNTVCTPYMHGSGQPYKPVYVPIWLGLARTVYMHHI